MLVDMALHGDAVKLPNREVIADTEVEMVYLISWLLCRRSKIGVSLIFPARRRIKEEEEEMKLAKEYKNYWDHGTISSP